MLGINILQIHKMFLLFLPLVYASMYDHELMLESASLQSEVIEARALNEYTELLQKEILTYSWDYKTNVSADEMFKMTIPILKGMAMSVLDIYESKENIEDTMGSCDELIVNSTDKFTSIQNYFVSPKVDMDFQDDINQKLQLMETEIQFIVELCDNIVDIVKSLLNMAVMYNDWSQIILTRAQMILEKYKDRHQMEQHLNKESTLNYTEAVHNFSLMENLTSAIHTLHHNLTNTE